MTAQRVPSSWARSGAERPTSLYWTEAVLNHSRARGIARTILLAIAVSSGSGGAWPGNDRLRTYAGGPGTRPAAPGEPDGRVTERAVWKAIKHLQDIGELRVIKNGGGFPDDTRPPSLRPNRYEVLVHCTEWCQRGRHRDSAPPDSPLWT